MKNPYLFEVLVRSATKAVCEPLLFLLVLALPALSVELRPSDSKGKEIKPMRIRVEDRSLDAWETGRHPVEFRLGPTMREFEGCEALYVQVSYLDKGYGWLDARLTAGKGRGLKPDRYLGMTMTDSGDLIHARMRFRSVPRSEELAVSIGVRHSDEPLAVTQVIVQAEPFDDPKFKFVISDPWLGPYKGPSLKATDNGTLVNKVMVGYQGWFRTPNDPYGRGWVHWGDIRKGEFGVDMWPDVSEYPADVLEKACDVKLESGKQAYLFSSAWPEIVDTHFRWMRENEIDGAFLQRFVSDRFHAVSGGDEWVLANVRAAANRQGRIWAVEYDVSGYSDEKLLETMKADWKWMVDEFKLLEDQNYAREGEKPVVFIWGLPVQNRGYRPETADAVLDFFKNDPQYGGNYVIGGIPGSFRKLGEAWQEHIINYNCVLPWMSKTYAKDIEDLGTLGLPYYAHVKPGFSWANLKRLPTGDDTIAYTPRNKGEFYLKQLKESTSAGIERLFVGMFDEYDEGTAIMPMSDDTPPTPVRPGVGATFYNGSRAGESGVFARLPNLELDLNEVPPARGIGSDHFFVRMGGRITFPTDGQWCFEIEGNPGDGVRLVVAGKDLIQNRSFPGRLMSGESLTVREGESLPYRLEYAHRSGAGKLRLLWKLEGGIATPVPERALEDAWGRFIDNEGQPADLYLKYTARGRRMMNSRAQ